MRTQRQAPSALSPSERAIAARIDGIASAADALPIRDPDLAEVMELLHRMAACYSAVPVQWMAGDAIKKLRAYAAKQSKGGV
ncbi:hypothetical protein [Paraburkholderia xenovorans]|uniref:hypothetical protein n=1 Tax=Paraburkholderia xenovorans TaxID=36873 RepID=UPI0038B707B4